jgi:NADH-quinone oxidoreductase E subunit
MSEYTWSDQAEAAAAEVLSKYPQKRSAMMPLLYIAMNEDGYLTEDGMRRVAELTGVTPAQVQSVASFYTMYKREPVGDYLVSVCTSISCWLLGADDVLHAVEEAAGAPAGARTGDGLMTVEHVECIGACGGAPAVQVNYETIEGVTPEKSKELVEWLRNARPRVVSCDEMQALFGGDKAFDWAVAETDGATGPHPAFPAYGNVESVGKGGDA